MQNNNIQYVLITAPARHGKDTFFKLLSELYPNKFRCYHYADELKDDIENFIWEQFDINVKTAEGEEKELIRPLLIALGEAHRKTDPLYWVKKVYKTILFHQENLPEFIPVIVDHRYANEIEFFKNKYPNQCVAVKIRRIGGPEPTNAEKISLPLIEPLVDYSIEWPNVDNVDELKVYIRDFYNKYFYETEIV